MNFAFSLTHKNFVVETQWVGELTGEIISTGVISHNNWIINNSDRLPLVLLFDFTKANLNNVTETDLQNITSRFSGIEDMFPGVNWIGIMPKDVKYSTVRMWLVHAENFSQNSHVVSNRPNAMKIISGVINSYSGM